MAVVLRGTPYEVEAGSVECSGTITLDLPIRGAVEYPCNVWSWFESAEGYVDGYGVVLWECPECGTLNEFEIGD